MQLTQQVTARVQTFTDRFPYVGPLAWIVSLQYFVVQIVATRAWPTPFSLINNLISDLGNTACGTYSGRYVCSPLHGLMNASFVLLGVTMMIGALLIYQEFKETTYSAIGFGFMGLAAFGTLLVGLFPENVNSTVHFLGALLPFVLGNVGIVLLGLVLELPRWLRDFTLFMGLLALVALPFFITHTYLGIGAGGLERVVAYPQTIWLIVFGVYISRNHYMAAKAAS